MAAEASTSTFINAINDAYKAITTDPATDPATDKLITTDDVKESKCIKFLIDKLNKSESESESKDDKAISITKWNYGYYLNNIDKDKEYLLFFKLLLDLLKSTTFNNITYKADILNFIEYLCSNIKQLYNFFRKFHNNNNIKNINKILLNIHHYFSYDYLNPTISYENIKIELIRLFIISNIRADIIEKESITLLAGDNTLDGFINFIDLITFINLFDIENITNTKIKISPKKNDEYNNIVLYLLAKLLYKETNYSINNILSNIIITVKGKFTDLLDIFKKCKDLNQDATIKKSILLKKHTDSLEILNNNNNINKAIKELTDANLTSLVDYDNYIKNNIIDKLFADIPHYEFIIINKDKDIIDFYKESPLKEDDYNIDNNSMKLLEYNNNINFNSHNYNLFGYIDNDNNFNEMKEEDEANIQNYKLKIYKINTAGKKQEEIKKEIKEEIESKLKEKLNTTQNCTNIKLINISNSCYIDSIIVALFNKKHTYMDNLLYNLDTSNKNIEKNTINIDIDIDPIIKRIEFDLIIDDNIKKELFYYRTLIKLELIYLYKTISMKNNYYSENNNYNLIKLRKYIQEYIDHALNATDITYNNLKLFNTDNVNINPIDIDTLEKIIKDINININIDNTVDKTVYYDKNKNDLYKIISNKSLTEDKDWNTSYRDIIDVIYIFKEIFKDKNDDFINFGQLIPETSPEKNSFTINELLTKLEKESGKTDNYINNIKFPIFYHINKLEILDDKKKSTLIKIDIIIDYKIENLQSIILNNGGDSGCHYTCLFKCNDKWYLYNDITAIKQIEEDFKTMIDKYKQNIIGLYYI